MESRTSPSYWLGVMATVTSICVAYSALASDSAGSFKNSSQGSPHSSKGGSRFFSGAMTRVEKKASSMVSLNSYCIRCRSMFGVSVLRLGSFYFTSGSLAGIIENNRNITSRYKYN